jgi:hypothetical protein
MPQLAASLRVSTHVLAQASAAPPAHTHCPLMHAPPTPQLWPHTPQFPASESGFVQTALHAS